jgi:hypothetical protein
MKGKIVIRTTVKSAKGTIPYNLILQSQIVGPEEGVFPVTEELLCTIKEILEDIYSVNKYLYN